MEKSGKDLRAEVKKTAPKDELKDYSGPFKPDLRYSDFTKEQLVKMYLMAGEYTYRLNEAWMNHILEKYGLEAVMESTYEIWGNKFWEPAQIIKRRWMNITGNDLEAMMKEVQMDQTSPPVLFDMQFEMPSKNRAILTAYHCPVVDMFEGLGMEAALGEICQKACVDSYDRNAKRYDPNIESKVLAIPPRKSKEDICCKFEFILNKRK